MNIRLFPHGGFFSLVFVVAPCLGQVSYWGSFQHFPCGQHLPVGFLVVSTGHGCAVAQEYTCTHPSPYTWTSIKLKDKLRDREKRNEFWCHGNDFGKGTMVKGTCTRCTFSPTHAEKQCFIAVFSKTLEIRCSSLGCSSCRESCWGAQVQHSVARKHQNGTLLLGGNHGGKAALWGHALSQSNASVTSRKEPLRVTLVLSSIF